MPKRNVELLTKVRDLIKTEPAKLDMGSWGIVREVELGYGDKVKISCGTTACIAGWAVQLAGDKLLVDGRNESAEGGYFVVNSVAKNGRVCDINDRATKLLGLTYEESSVLFLDTADENAVDMINQLIAGEDIAVPSDDYYDDDDEY